ncbi:MAG: hypothetical protein FWC58_10075 [Desulfobulbus sp.]|nr:hypothetical protein [Desulfobulbus sp.]
MSQKSVVIPISPAGFSCSTGVSTGGCAAASSCSSASACGSAGGNGDDPALRLRQEGWVLRTTIGEPRLSEIAENYQAMGQEVHIEYFEAPKPAAGGCTTCFDAPDGAGAAASGNQVWGSIYVRPGKPGRAKDEELY